MEKLNADGSYEITIMTKAIIHFNGRVEWNPPAIYKSYCPIDVQYFPFDTQLCFWKFSSWSYGGYSVNKKTHFVYRQQVDLIQQINESSMINESSKTWGMDLSEFYLNVEWDVMNVVSFRKEKFYNCCPEPYPNLFFNITIRRKTLFYTVNLIIPCLGISGLSVLVFYLPSDSREKVSLTISILLSLNFFLLVLIEIIPSTSLAMPLLGKYLVFTMSLVTLSVVVTIIVLNVHFRSPSTHRMPPWVRKLFIHTLPKILLMRPPQYRFETEEQSAKASRNGNGGKCILKHSKSLYYFRFTESKTKACFQVLLIYSTLSYFNGELVDTFASSPSTTRRMNQLRHSFSTVVPTQSSPMAEELIINELDSSPGAETNANVLCYPREIEKAITNAMFIAQHIDNADEYSSVKEDWKYVAMVLDRIFLWIFTSACIVGTAGIFLQAPTLYDSAEPIDVKLSNLSRSLFEGYFDD
ncbi:nicotinic acetylcholine receptor subunit alpha 1-like protein [Leptotrombidium deliense]|uniref:Nicotinic acetylcholine receptor subunit alpha 1-like protein n=1 Tax=Leptotrombidium deliense TaxID=299467 RepID=A0A443SEW9_9ACAR|nr:nicotinic acetylcholine receptor subunit alpha 1-like protein [Leptotrombidium deliense]